MEALNESIVKLSRNACPLGDSRLQRHLKLATQLQCRMVERPPKDGQFVISTDVDFVPKIAACQRPCACGKFGERDSDSPGDIPPQRCGREQSQQPRGWNYDEKAMAHLLGFFVDPCPLLKYP